MDLKMAFRRLLRRLYGLGGYALGGLVTPYFLLFAGDTFVPLSVNHGAGDALRTLDAAGVPGAPDALDALARLDAVAGIRGLGAHPVAAIAIDLALIALFGLQHSLMTRPAWRRWHARWLPASIERTTYILATCLVLAVAMVAWQPIGGTVWQLDGSWARAMTCAYVAGIALVYAAALWLDHLHLLGLRQAWTDAPTADPTELRVTGPYRFVRHPLMTGLLVVFWCTPHMTWSQLVLAGGMTAYIVVGTLHEERRLARMFGAAYAAYARLTPMLTPVFVPAIMRYRTRRRPARPASPPASPPAGASAVPAGAPPGPIVRRPDIDFAPYGPSVWHLDNVVATALLNAYSVLFPPLERFMADELRATLPDLRDRELARDVRDFVGQESVHAHEHGKSLACLTGLGYRVAWLDRFYGLVTRRGLRPVIRYLVRPVLAATGSVSIFAGVEHWTATLSELVLRRDYPRGYSPFVALYYWHAAEELEHKAVVADVLAHLGGSYPVRIFSFVMGTLAFAALSAIGTLVFLAQIPALQGRGVFGYLTYPLRVLWDGTSYFLVREKVAWHALRSMIAYLIPFHHPDWRATGALVQLGLEASAESGASLRELPRTVA
jgi:predicted metal-dependent hydrolase/protein-S-isoprenylcysteine O-methyltransferase Ste14